MTELCRAASAAGFQFPRPSPVVTPHVADAHVIGEDQDDVRAGCARRIRCRRRGEGKRNEEEAAFHIGDDTVFSACAVSTRAAGADRVVPPEADKSRVGR